MYCWHCFFVHSYYVNDYSRQFKRDKNVEGQLKQNLGSVAIPGSKISNLRLKHQMPSNGSLLCNFNNLYKLSPDMFEQWIEVCSHSLTASSFENKILKCAVTEWWLQVLQRVPESSMVLLSLPQDAVPNLQNEANARLVNSSRSEWLCLVYKNMDAWIIAIMNPSNVHKYIDTSCYLCFPIPL